MFKKIKKTLFPNKYLMRKLMIDQRNKQDVIISELKSLYGEMQVIRRKLTSFTYLDVEGFFDATDANFYRFLVSQLDNDENCVEIGSWMGRSTVFLGQEIQQKKLNSKIYAVDTWKGSQNEKDHINLVKAVGGDLLPIFKNNIRSAGVESIVIPIQKSSIEAASQFSEKVKFVFIDGDHSYEAVLQDIDAWVKHIKPGGIVAGHDYTWAEVAKAVGERFTHFGVIGNCWIAQLSDYKK